LNTDSTLTINGSGFEALGAGSKIEQIQGVNVVELADGTWGGTQIVTTGADVEATVLKYGTHDITVTADSSATATLATNAVPATNNSFVNLTSVATSGDRITAIPDLAALDQVRYQSVLFQGGSPTANTVTVNVDATFTISGGTPDGNYTFEVRAWDDNDETWGTAASLVIPAFNVHVPNLIKPASSAVNAPSGTAINVLAPLSFIVNVTAPAPISTL